MSKYLQEVALVRKKGLVVGLAKTHYYYEKWAQHGSEQMLDMFERMEAGRKAKVLTVQVDSTLALVDDRPMQKVVDDRPR